MMKGRRDKENIPGNGNFDIRTWMKDHGGIVTSRNSRTKKWTSPGIDITALTKKEGGKGSGRYCPFNPPAKKGYTFDVLFQELQAEGFNGDIDDAFKLLQRQVTEGIGGHVAEREYRATQEEIEEYERSLAQEEVERREALKDEDFD